MPILSFQCLACEKKFDELVYSPNWDKVLCPQCKSKEIKRTYEGKCYFGLLGSTTARSGCEGRSCSGCSGCH